MEFKDYYKILGVAADADSKTIKTAYRKLARKYHPDMNPDKGAEDKFKEVAEACEVLKDEGRRAEFDELRKYGGRSHRDFQPPPGWQESRGYHSQAGDQFEGDFSEFFNSIFGARGNAFHTGGHRTEGVRGQDVEIEMPVFLEETQTENFKTVEYHIPVVEQGQLTHLKKHLRVKIPQGVTDGERVRVKGQGAPGFRDGVAGDLYLHIRLVPHPLFDVQGHHLMLTLPLAPWEAALGCKVTVPTLDGKVSLTIAPHTPAGKKLRVKGKGLKSKGSTGDLYVVVKIVMPPTASPNAAKLWQALAASESFDPRADWSNA